MHLYINFNGATSRHQNDVKGSDIWVGPAGWDETAEEAMGVRLLASALKISYEDLIQLPVVKANKNVLIPTNVVPAILGRHRQIHNLNANDFMMLYVHIDEIQLAYDETGRDQGLRKPMAYLKDMVRSLFDTFGMQPSNNFMLVPLLVKKKKKSLIVNTLI